MSVFVYCTNAAALLAEIELHLATENARTWSINAATRQITHNPNQWHHQAYLIGSVNEENDLINFNFSMGPGILGEEKKTREMLYPYYHGRFISFLMDDFYSQFRRVAAPGGAARLMKLK